MRNHVSRFLELDPEYIKNIKIDPKSRDDIPRLLRGLQNIYATQELRDKIFEILEQELLPKVDKNNGRPGMPLWNIFVLGVLRLDLNCDYDKVRELANEHRTIRKMLGHIDFTLEYPIQTIRDNVNLLTEDILIKINTLLINHGHVLLKKRGNKATWAIRLLRGRD